MGKEAKKALSKSLEEFKDISGITINERTGNIVSGNHRWEELQRVYGPKDLKLVHLKDEYYVLTHKKKSTGFTVRVVDWDEPKELAANISANSSLIQGEFTSGLQGVLDEIEAALDFDLIEDLRLDELKVDLDDIDTLDDWDDGDLTEDKARKANDDMKASTTPEAGALTYITETIKINVPANSVDDIKKDIAEMFATKDYADDVVIV